MFVTHPLAHQLPVLVTKGWSVPVKALSTGTSWTGRNNCQVHNHLLPLVSPLPRQVPRLTWKWNWSKWVGEADYPLPNPSLPGFWAHNSHAAGIPVDVYNLSLPSISHNNLENVHLRDQSPSPGPSTQFSQTQVMNRKKQGTPLAAKSHCPFFWVSWCVSAVYASFEGKLIGSSWKQTKHRTWAPPIGCAVTIFNLYSVGSSRRKPTVNLQNSKEEYVVQCSCLNTRMEGKDEWVLGMYFCEAGQGVPPIKPGA